jgi:hypothetical protein
MYMLRVPNRLSHEVAHVLPQQLTTLHRELTAHKAHGIIAQAVEAFFLFPEAFFLFPSILERRGEVQSCPHAQGEFSVGRVAAPMWASPARMWASQFRCRCGRVPAQGCSTGTAVTYTPSSSEATSRKNSKTYAWMGRCDGCETHALLRRSPRSAPSVPHGVSRVRRQRVVD